MERGPNGLDIANTSARRFLFVFETVLAHVDRKEEKKRKAALRFKRYKAAAGMWTLDPLGANYLWDWSARHGVACDILTYLHPLEAEHVKESLEDLGYPFGNFLVATPDNVRIAVNRPDVLIVFDFNPGNNIHYGAKHRRSWQDPV